MILTLQDGAWYSEHNGTTYVTVPQILMELSEVFIHYDNICQTLHDISFVNGGGSGHGHVAIVVTARERLTSHNLTTICFFSVTGSHAVQHQSQASTVQISY